MQFASLAAAGLADSALARPLCALLRQLVSSDGNKELVVGCGGLGVLARVLAAHAGDGDGASSPSPAVLEAALGLLTNITLRNPEAAAKVG